MFITLGLVAFVILLVLFLNTGISERERADREFREFEKDLHLRHLNDMNRMHK